MEFFDNCEPINNFGLVKVTSLSNDKFCQCIDANLYFKHYCEGQRIKNATDIGIWMNSTTDFIDDVYTNFPTPNIANIDIVIIEILRCLKKVLGVENSKTRSFKALTKHLIKYENRDKDINYNPYTGQVIVDYKDIKRIWKANYPYRHTNIKACLNTLIKSLLIFNEPIIWYNDIYIGTGSDYDNELIKDDGVYTIHFKKFKQIYRLNKKVTKYIDDSLENYPRQFLFCKVDNVNVPMSAKDICDLLSDFDINVLALQQSKIKTIMYGKVLNNKQLEHIACRYLTKFSFIKSYYKDINKLQ